MLKAKSKTYYSFFVFLAIVVVVFFVATSLIGKLKSDSDKIRDQEILLSRLSKQKSQIGRIRADYQSQKKKMEKVEKSFLNPKETVDFVVEVEKIARKSSVKLETKTTERNAGESELSPFFNYQLIVTGKFNNVMRFLTYLENIKYNIIINGLKITAMGGNEEKQSSSNNGVKVIVDLEVYTSEQL